MANATTKLEIEKVILQEMPGGETTKLEFHYLMGTRQIIDVAEAGLSIDDCQDKLESMGILCITHPMK